MWGRGEELSQGFPLPLCVQHLVLLEQPLLQGGRSLFACLSQCCDLGFPGVDRCLCLSHPLLPLPFQPFVFRFLKLALLDQGGSGCLIYPRLAQLFPSLLLRFEKSLSFRKGLVGLRLFLLGGVAKGDITHILLQAIDLLIDGGDPLLLLREIAVRT